MTDLSLSKHWHVPVKLLLGLLGTSLFSLVLTLVLTAISTSGVQSMGAAMVFLWAAYGIFVLTLLSALTRASTLPGGKSAMFTLLLVALGTAGYFGCAGIAGWLNRQKAAQVVVQTAPPSLVKPPSGQALPAPKAPVVHSPKPQVRTKIEANPSGNGNTANPGVNNGSVKQGDCGVFQNGGSGNIAAPNCGPPPVALSYRFLSAERDHIMFDEKPGFIKTEILIVPNQQVTGPFLISMEFDNPISAIAQTVVNVGAVISGGPQSLGKHAAVTVQNNIGPLHPLVVAVFSTLPVKILSAPQISQ